MTQKPVIGDIPKTHGKRTQPQRERDIAYAAKLYMQGNSQQAIADKISDERPYTLSKQTICNDLREIQKRWKESATEKYETVMYAQLAKIDNLESEYWDAWENSKKKKTKRQAEKGAGGDRTKVQVSESTGDPRFLEGVRWCIMKREEILGGKKIQRPNNGKGDRGPRVIFEDNGKGPSEEDVSTDGHTSPRGTSAGIQ